ncbi:MAG: acyl-CoA thioesterase [Deinococcus-Thermus bacterium]|jgi:acyl-CoA hydrolase|nr:acyl-CoA thioesterase [Deinococcota bacterium]
MPIDPGETRRSPWLTSLSSVFPHHANPLGTLFGGHALQLMDVNASIACNRFCRHIAVTASSEPIDFRNPVRVGDILEVRSRVAWVGRTSMIVRTEVHSEHPTSGERRLTTVGHLNFVAIGEDGRPAAVPRLAVDTEEERRHYQVAERVRAAIQARRAEE